MANAKIEIPTVDIRPWLSPSASLAQKRQVVAEVRDAACKYGFFQLVGHHISLQEQKDIMDRCKLFYDRLTEEQKMDLWIKKAGIAFRGYEPPKIQKHHAHLKPDTKEVGVFSFLSRCDYISFFANFDVPTGSPTWP